MKKINLSFLLIIATFVAAFSQVPNAFNYQAVVRNLSGEIISNQSVSFRISILESSESGTVVYSETHTLSTNNFGLANFEIGNGENTTGTFAAAAWGDAPHFVKIEFDPAGGTAFLHLATSKLVSVPYAFHAQTVENDAVDDADADATNEIQTMTLTGTLLELSDGGGSVTLPTSGSSDGDNWGAQTVETDETLAGDGTSTDPLSVVGDLTDNQTLSVSGDDLTISDGNTVALPNNSKWDTGTYGISHTNSHVGIGAGATDGSSLTVMNTSGNALFAGNSDAMNPPLQVYNQNASGAAAYFRNKIIIKDGTQGEGKVLTSDATGNTSWVTPTSNNLWTSSGENIVYSEGSVNVGGVTPDSRILLQSSTNSNLYALGAINNGSNPTIYAMNNGTGPSAWIAGKVKISDGTESNGKVLTSDANGLASWQTPATGGSSLWTESGSNVYRSSGRVGIGTTTPTAILDVRNSDPSVASIYTEKVNGWAFHANSYESNGVSVAAMSSGGTAIIAEAAGAGTVKLASTEDDAAGYFQGNVYMTSGNVGIGTTSPSEKLHIVAGDVLVDENLNIGKDLTVNGGNFDLNSTGENWLSVLRGDGQNAGIAFKEVGAASTQWIFPYFRGWQSDNLIVRDEAAGKDVMTFEAATGNVKVDGKITSSASGNNDLKAFAYGNINSDGAIISGTGNFSIDTGAGTGIYKITFSNESYDIQHFVTILSISSLSLPKFIQNYSTNGTLVVRIIATDGAFSNNNFSFVTYKK